MNTLNYSDVATLSFNFAIEVMTVTLPEVLEVQWRPLGPCTLLLFITMLRLINSPMSMDNIKTLNGLMNWQWWRDYSRESGLNFSSAI